MTRPTQLYVLVIERSFASGNNVCSRSTAALSATVGRSFRISFGMDRWAAKAVLPGISDVPPRRYAGLHSTPGLPVEWNETSCCVPFP